MELTGQEVFSYSDQDLLREINKSRAFIKYYDEHVECWEYIFCYKNRYYSINQQNDERRLTPSDLKMIYGKALLGVILETDALELISKVHEGYVLEKDGKIICQFDEVKVFYEIISCYSDRDIKLREINDEEI